MTTEAPQRKYALTKVTSGDYLLPSNDGKTIWRIMRYTDGPSNGLDIPRDRDFWEVRRWTAKGLDQYVDLEDWDRWQSEVSLLDTRAEAINTALAMT
jgi:hypothetical protein